LNRKAIMLSAALLLLMFSSLGIPCYSSQQPYRVIEVNEYGLVYVYDVLPGVGGELRIGFPRSLVRNLVNYACPEDPDPELKVEEDAFYIIVDSKAGQPIHLTTIFRDVIAWDPRREAFELDMPLHPRVRGLGKTDYPVTVKLPRDSEILEVSPGLLNQSGKEVLSGVLEGVDLSGAAFQMLKLSFTSDLLKPVDIRSATMRLKLPDRLITLDMKILNLGGPDISQLNLKLPEGSKLIDVRDALGSLSRKYDEETGGLRVFLRQPLAAGSLASLIVSFQAPGGSDAIRVSEGSSIISPYLPMNSTAWLYRIEIVLAGGEPFSWDPEPLEFRREYPGKSVLAYRFTHVDPINAGSLRIKLEYRSGFSPLQLLPYFALASTIFMACSVTAVYLTRGRGAARRVGLLDRLLDEYQLLTLSYQSAADLLSSEKIYNRSYARRTLLGIRSDVRRSVGRLGRAAEELRRAKPEVSGEAGRLEEAAKLFEEAVEKIWNEVYPYLSGSAPRRRLEAILEGRRRELREAYERLSDSLELLRRGLRRAS